MHQLTFETAQKILLEQYSKNNILQELRAFLKKSFPSAGPILVVGGFLRDTLRGADIMHRDIDITIGNIAPDVLFGLPGAECNFFGGIELLYQGQSVDIWPLQETYHIKKFQLPATIEGFLAGAPFNLDKIVFDIGAGQLYEDGCVAGLAEKKIVYCPARPYLEHIQAARAILLQQKTDFSLDESVIALFRRASGKLQNSKTLTAEVCDYIYRLKQFKNRGECMKIVEKIIYYNAVSNN
ncbi:hypothetical protein L6259_00700 [Candidatus Parcubacteria bacterium]|nr:hypothetical protein [Patescibacteria group bacterium]MCG2693791.1 hypothetical protein [Candidatus Parcubacteria bacterium]